MKKFKWFNNPKTAEEVKSQYRELCMANHPDLGGSTEDMQEINSEYGELWNILKDIHTNKDCETYTSSTPTDEQPEEFIHIIEVLMHFAGVKLELCGSWLWVTGDTKPYKEDLKHLGFKYAYKKNAWFYHHGKYIKRSKKSFNMNDIREMWGSEDAETEHRTPQIAG